ncbi:Purine permease 3 [Rhynchospora pubera]|uniref:Probable purine permease n=1 Tax=Rhynchospora pubera TaxID=906938 RepID=A0AAV8DN62_9POAL|nr:Purine permease 3 [Rhynchospora pubera]
MATTRESPLPILATTQESPLPKSTLSPFTLVNSVFLMVGSGGAALLLRIYFIHGGQRIWLSSFLQVAGWPLLLLPLSFSAKKFNLSLFIYSVFTFIGIFWALDSYLYALASSLLPLSTSSLVICSQLAFTAVSAFLLVRQRFTPYSFNAVVLLTIGPAVLTLGEGSDRPEGESKGKYIFGLLMAVAAAALAGFIFATMELVMRRGKVVQTYAAAIEMQLAISISGSVFCLIGMIINNDFQAIQREAREFGLGRTKYFMVLIWDAVFWQLSTIGLIGLVSGASSLFVSVMIALTLPLIEILAVIFLHEKFSASKGIALVLSIWGFISYLYGEKRQSDKAKKVAQQEPVTRAENELSANELT